MNPSAFFFAAFAATVAALAWIAVWAPRRPAPKLAALAFAGFSLLLGYLALAELTGRPKSVRDEWLRARTEEARVLAFDLVEGEAIYLWLRLPDLDEPRAYRLPWSLPLARELQRAARAAERQGTGLAMRLPFEPSLEDREPKVYPLPQPPAPPKEVPPPPLVLSPSRPSGRRRLRVRGRPSRTRSTSVLRSPAPPTGAAGARARDPRGADRP
ncbi:MAG: hypothetical protein NZP72_04915 [Geminicoccaceae bacterium]|nr:hypothetical protein [Geminicoccaceae bacterium]